MFTKEQIEEKIKEIDEEIGDHESEIPKLELKRTGAIQNLINSDTGIQSINLEVQTKIAAINRLNGKKDVFMDMLSMLDPPKKKKKSK